MSHAVFSDLRHLSSNKCILLTDRFFGTGKMVFQIEPALNPATIKVTAKGHLRPCSTGPIEPAFTRKGSAVCVHNIMEYRAVFDFSKSMKATDRVFTRV
jgi:hypothetical protein